MKLFDNQGSYTFALLIVCMLVNTSAAAEARNSPDKPLVFGIAPFMSPMALINRMAPLRDYIAKALNMEVVIETTTDAREFAQRTLNGRYDFVLTNPTFSLMAMDSGQFLIIATQKKKLSGYFIVLENSDIHTIEGLAGNKVGAPPKVGFMGQLIEPYLQQFNFTPEKFPLVQHFNSHNAAVSALRLGDTDATLIVSFMEKHLRKKGLTFKIIHRTQEFPGMTILARHDMRPDMAKKLRYSLLNMDKHEKGKNVLSKISMPGYQKLDMTELEKVRPFIPPKKIK